VRAVVSLSLLTMVAGASAQTIRRQGPAIRGVVFALPWEFDEPVDFFVDGARRSFTRGEIVGLAVEPGLFRPRAGPRPTIYVDGTAAIDRGGPFGSADHPFVVVQIPAADLTVARFWVGPRTPPDRATAEEVRAAQGAATQRGRLAGPLTSAHLAAARTVFAPAAHPRSAADLHRSLRDFCRATDLRRLVMFEFDR